MALRSMTDYNCVTVQGRIRRCSGMPSWQQPSRLALDSNPICTPGLQVTRLNFLYRSFMRPPRPAVDQPLRRRFLTLCAATQAGSIS